MSTEYSDRWITCGADGIAIRGYYFPWGTKHIPYDRIRSVKRVNMGAITGRGRIWGTANLRYWASLDPGRSRKRVGLILDVGAAVKPYLTPDDPQAALDAIHHHTGSHPVTGGRGPFV
jgi:hypothetical protein